MNRPKRLTRDMIEAAAREGWNAIQTARHYGVHRNIIDDACERFDIVLPHRGTDYTALVSGRPRKKPTEVWSASPDAIKRALDKIQRDMQLQSTSNNTK